MTLLLDTSVVIDLQRCSEEYFGDEQLAVSAVSVGELAFGLDTGSGDSERTARQGLLDEVLQNFEIIAFGVEEAKFYGVLATLVRSAGRNPRPRRLDLQIAATAATTRLPLLTANPRDFDGLGRMVDVIGA